MRSLIFGIAFLYTMETWWIASWLEYGRLMLFYIAAFLVDLYLLPLTSKQARAHSVGWVIRTTVTNKGLALLVAGIILTVLGQISPLNPPFEKDLATILLLSIPIGVGANVAQLLEIYQKPGRQGADKGQQGKRQGDRSASSGEGENGDEGNRTEEEKEDQQRGGDDEAEGDEEAQGGKQGRKKRNPWWEIIRLMGLVSGGALFVGLPLAPTEEIPMLASRIDFWRELALIGAALAITYILVYASGADRDPPSGRNSPGADIWPLADTLLSYGMALLVSFVVLYLFGQITSQTPIQQMISLTIVLGLPAAIGGAAGKLAL